MSFFRNQFADVIEWDEFRDDMIFWKWSNKEIKKGSRLIIRPGQDAIFLYNGKIEGVFKDEGDYNIESEIIPFLSTLKGFKFGFNSGLRVEVIFVNTKIFNVKWGTRNAINIPAPQLNLPGGLPIRANGTFEFKVNDYIALIDNIAGVKNRYLVDDVKIRITTILDQLLMKWITRAGKDILNLQMNSTEISRGIQEDLDMEIHQMGMTITGFSVGDFNYPKQVQDMINKSASHGMVGDVSKYQQISVTDAMASGKLQGSGTASDMAGMMMGMTMANKMMDNMNQNNSQDQMKQQNQNQQNQNEPTQSESNKPSEGTNKAPNFCPNCGQKTNGANFCSNCGQKLV
ncbi:SPFH domain-containing protein [Paucisalibacillus globulus]|uniref:SPFH domain-containing protein n=1 Tax=Paucisalibacillus globulus TaxID=351095 RepID=UPI000BB7A43F|nr:SPFH domain-containing protein [Paucisalibacillus globulus]